MLIPKTILTWMKKQVTKRSQSPRRRRSASRLAERLEGRTMPAQLVWVGDVDANWATENAGDTNWSNNVLPQDGDDLLFPFVSDNHTNTNDIADLDLRSIEFGGIDYAVDGNAITLSTSLKDASTDGLNSLTVDIVQSGALIVSVPVATTTLTLGNLTVTAQLTTTGSVTLNGNALLFDFTANNASQSVTLAGSGADSVTFTLNGGAAATLGGIGALNVNTGAGSDILTVDFTDGNLIPSGGNGIVYDGGGNSGDSLVLVHGNFDTITNNLTDAGAGDVTLTPQGLAESTLVTYSGLSPVLINVGTVADITFNLPNAPNPDVVISDDTGINDANRSAITGSTFEDTEFTNPTNSLTVNGTGDNVDTIALRTMDSGFAPAIGFTVDTGAGDDFVNVLQTNAGYETNVTSSDGTETVNVGNAGSVQGILGTLSISNPSPALFSHVTVDDSADGLLKDNVILTNNSITNLAPAVINYVASGIDTLTINGGSNNNTYHVESTLQGTPGTTNINAGSGNDIFFIDAASLGTDSVNNFSGGEGADEFNVSNALASAELNINGGDPSTSPGDTLNVPVGSDNVPTGPGAGSVTGVVTSYTNIESVGFVVFLNGTEGNDTFVIKRNGGNLELYVNGALDQTYDINDVNKIVVTGDFEGGEGQVVVGNDTLTVDYSGGAIPAAIAYDGGSQTNAIGDQLFAIGGDFDSGESTPSGTPDAEGLDGTLTHVGGTTGTVGVITYTGLSPVTDTTTVATFTINATAGADTINIINGPVAGQTQVNSGAAPTFELVNFANKTNVTVNALGGVDTITVNNSNPATGLKTLTVDSGDGNDTVNVLATPATVATTVTSTVGGGTTDTVNVGNNNSAQGILGTLNIQNPPGLSNINLNDALDGVGRTITFDSGVITGLAPATINYVTGDVATLTLNSGTGGNTITVVSTGGTGNYVINGGSGDDTLVVNGIVGTNDDLQVTPTAAGSGGIVDSGVAAFAPITFTRIDHITAIGQTANADGFRMIDTSGNDTFEVTPGPTPDAGSMTGFRAGAGGFTFVPVRYSGFTTFTSFPNDLGQNVGGNDTLIVNGTAADDVFQYRKSSGFANDVIVVNGGTEIFSSAQTKILRGLDGNDTFNVSNVPATPTLGRSIRVEGGDSDQFTDTLNYTAPAGATTTIDIGASTIASTGANTVTFSGVERVNETSSGGGSALTVTGTAGDDTINVTPTAAGVGSFVRLGLGGSPLFTYTGVAGAFTVGGGSGGTDVLGILGSEANDTVTSTATTVTIAGGTVTLGTGLDRLDISTFGGTDNVLLTGLTIAKVVDAGTGNDTVDLSAAVDATILGGSGDDSLVGSPAADVIFGGAGNDTLLGGGGNDVLNGDEGNDSALGGTGADQFFGGDGSDSFTWNPGDGSDTVEGGAGEQDVLVFNGAATAELFTFNAVGNRLEVLREVVGVVGIVDLDVADVEQVNLNMLGGTDTAIVNDLTGTDVGLLNLDVGPAVPVGAVADTVADAVTVNGRNVADDLAVSVASSVVSVQGLSYSVNVSSATTTDTLTINGNAGDDTIKANSGVEATVKIVLNGNDGDDYLSADATLNGNAGNDTLVGGTGADSLSGGAGDDVLTGLGGADTISGGDGYDTVVESRDANFTLTDSSLVIGAEGTDTLSSIEAANLTGGNSGNTFAIGDFSGATSVTGGRGVDEIDFSGAEAGINIDLDVINAEQVIYADPSRGTLFLGDAVENLTTTDFNDLIKIKIGAFDRLIIGGGEDNIRPGDTLCVDMLGARATVDKHANGKPGSFDGSVKNAAGYGGTIEFEDIETLTIKNAGSIGGIGGLFGAATNYPTSGKAPRGVQLAQLNDDNGDDAVNDLDFLDMVVANTSSKNVTVRMGTGFGTFSEAHTYLSGGKAPNTVALEDVDADGFVDIVVANKRSSTIGVLLNKGADGTPDDMFDDVTTFATAAKGKGKSPTTVKLVQMNDDNDDGAVDADDFLDAITANSTGTVSILFGNGDGTFDPATPDAIYKTGGKTPRDLVAADFNDDGFTDIVVANFGSKKVSFLAGDVDGNLAAATFFAVGKQPTSIVAADFNVDGNMDIAVTNQGSKTLSILLGNGDVDAVDQFQEQLQIFLPGIKKEVSLASGDLNGDGNVDLAISSRKNVLFVVFGFGNGTFTNPLASDVGDVRRREPVSVAIGDLNGDGRLDVVTANAGTNDVSVLLQNTIN